MNGLTGRGQSRFPITQDNSTKDGQEEERVLGETVEREQDAHVAEQDVDG